MLRLAFIVSHPIQYYAPLHQLLAARGDIAIKVFFTWHGGGPQWDAGFGKSFTWDIPLTDGYESEAIPNTSSDPGTHHFWGLRNPQLIPRVLDWRPDVIHQTGYSNASHLNALWTFSRRGIPVLFRGDSHLLDQKRSGWRWAVKKAALTQIFSLPAACLYVGEANREYYRSMGVPEERLVHCPHSIEVKRFAEPEEDLEKQAAAWRTELNIGPEKIVLLFAGKFEAKKRPVALMEALVKQADPRLLLVMVGDGELGPQVHQLAHDHPERFRVLPFQNQSRMPVVYRLGDVLVLPSAWGETWGLAVNEAMACGRPALVSNRVGCHADVIDPGKTGAVFEVDNWPDFFKKLASISLRGDNNQRQKIKSWSNNWSISRTADTLLAAVQRIVPPASSFSGR